MKQPIWKFISLDSDAHRVYIEIHSSNCTYEWELPIEMRIVQGALEIIISYFEDGIDYFKYHFSEGSWL